MLIAEKINNVKIAGSPTRSAVLPVPQARHAIKEMNDRYLRADFRLRKVHVALTTKLKVAATIKAITLAILCGKENKM